jgi:hypothetical protein
MAERQSETLKITCPRDLLPETIADFFTALNREDLPGVIGAFEPDAIINDQMQEVSGIDDIVDWAERDLFGFRMRASVLETRLRPSGAVVSASISGEFDAPGLPEPLILLFYFVLGDRRIEQLIILRNGI